MKTKLAIGVALAGAAVFGALVAGFSNAQPGDDQFTPEQEQAVRELVRDYLMDNPEVLIESLNAYAERERAHAAERAKDAARQNLSALLDEKHGFVAGAAPDKASVVVVEFFDYHCGFCKRASDFVKKLTKTDSDIKVVFREFPILRNESDYASEYALAARAQGKYADFHFAMMDQQGLMTKDRVMEVGEKVGVDAALAEKEMDNPDVKEAIDDTHRLAVELGIEGTPAFIVASLNGDFVDIIEGNRQDDVKAAIAEAKKAAKKK